MKFKMLLSLVTLVMASCQIENDMMIPKDLAGYEIFEIDGQVSSTINSSKQLVEVKMP